MALLALTIVLVVLTGVLIFYTICLVRSSTKLLGAMKDLKQAEENLLEIGLEYVGASIQRKVSIPYSFLGEDLEVLKGNMKVLEPLGGVSWNWGEDALELTYGLNRLPIVLQILQANARQPDLLNVRLAVDPLSILMCESYLRQQAMAKEFMK